MSTNRLTGSRIREQRLDQGLRQASVAEAVGISPSYLNLIEHNRRRIGGKLLGDLARVLGVDPGLLTEGADTRLLDEMRAAAAVFGATAEVARTEELAARYPGWSGLIAQQASRLAALDERVQVLTDRIAYDPHLAESLHEVISAVTAIRSSASILVGQETLDDDWQRRFHANIHDDSVRLASSSEALITYLETPEVEATAAVTPLEEVDAFLAHCDHQLPALEEGGDIDDVVIEAQLSGPATSLLRKVCAGYSADAAALPRAAFDKAVRSAAYDPIVLARQFGVGFATVLRRMASLSTNEGHPPMGLAVCDASGTMIVLKSVPGFRLPRFGGACPLWPIFGAFSRPAQPVRAEVMIPGAVPTSLLCYAVADLIDLPGFGGPPALQSTMLVLPDLPSDGSSAIPVGVSCRICPQADCKTRREPAIGGVSAHGNL